jgi:hypothetical protein
MSKEVDLKIKEDPYFVCGTCGYEDYLGNTECCPVCDPEENNKQDVCFFVDLEQSLCRQDGLKCPHIKEKNWEECVKLQGYGAKG